MTLTSAVLLCTRNRTDEVRRFLGSVESQTRRPDEILVIDGASRSDVRQIAESFSALPVRYLTVSGDLTVARNLGVRESRADVLFFLDDDLVLDTNFLERVMAVFESDLSCSIGGVCGTIRGYRRTRGIRALMNRIFFMPCDGDGSFRVSGAALWPFALTESRYVEFLPGGLTAYRREVFAAESFDEELPLFGFTDDVDFSRRVSLRFRNYYEPRAVADHIRPPSDRAMRFPILRLWIWAYWRNFHRNHFRILGYPALLLLIAGFVLRYLESRLKALAE